MFGLNRRNAAANDAVDTYGVGQSAPGQVAGGGKGHATPSRREAEEARKSQLKIPKDPKAAKKASRQRDQEDRARAREGMRNGEEKYLPARDRGPG